MALESNFWHIVMGGHSASLNLMLLFYFRFSLYYHHAEDDLAGIPMMQKTNLLYMIYIHKNKTSILKVLGYKVF